MNTDCFNLQQKASYNLIRNDLRYLYSIMKNSDYFDSNYIISSMPYMGLIIDGAEDWIEAYNNSSKSKIEIPLFTDEERCYYEEMRSSIKMWSGSYISMRNDLETLYLESDKYFSGLCKPIARELKLYDIFGADKADGHFCGNTILCSYYIPSYKYGENKGEQIKKLSEIAGKYIVSFDADEMYQINQGMVFTSIDYGGFVKSPVGNAFSDKFVLFSMLCQIQFVLYGVENFILEECSTKLRFAYLLYYYCCTMLKEINQQIGTHFKLDTVLVCKKFRNAMAHYKVGVALEENEIVQKDLFFGMTQKYFGCDYMTLKKAIIDNLYTLTNQLKEYLTL